MEKKCEIEWTYKLKFGENYLTVVGKDNSHYLDKLERIGFRNESVRLAKSIKFRGGRE